MILVISFVTVLIRKTSFKRLSDISGVPKWARCPKGAVQSGPLG